MISKLIETNIGDYILDLYPVTNCNPITQRPVVEKSKVGGKKPSKAQSIIGAIIDGFDIGEMKLVNIKDKTFTYESCDGGHRKRTMVSFFNNEFPIHETHEIFGGMYYRDLPSEIKEQFKSYPLRFVVYEDLPKYRIGKQFRITNTTTPVNKMEMLNSFGDVPHANLVREYVRYVEENDNQVHSLFKSYEKNEEVIFENLSTHNNRLKLEEAVARMVFRFYINKNVKEKTYLGTASFDEIFEMYKDESATNGITKDVESLFNHLLKLSQAKMKQCSGRGLSYSELVMASRMFLHFLDVESNYKVRCYDSLWLDFTNSLSSFIGKNPTRTKPHKDDRGVRTESEAMRGYLGIHDNYAKIEQSVTWLLEGIIISKHLIGRDSTRVFSRELIEQVLAKQNYTDYVDGKPLTMDDAVGAHVEAWSEGGKTIAENLVITSKYHNSKMGSLNVEAYKELIKKDS
tara:strand:+ start:199 stop:1572 length:1374 start_codon:yes stop_codon:yes gene_type:complete